MEHPITFLFPFPLRNGPRHGAACSSCDAAGVFPKESRGRWVAFMEGAVPVGIITAGLITYYLLPLVGGDGFLSLKRSRPMAIVVRRKMPESPRWLEAIGRHEDADKTMTMIENQVQKRSGKPLPPVEDIVLVETTEGGFKFGELWSKCISNGR